MWPFPGKRNVRLADRAICDSTDSMARRCIVSEDELFPVYRLTECGRWDEPYGVEITDEQFARYQRVQREWETVQEELERLRRRKEDPND